MNESRFVNKSRRKSEHFHDLLRIYMKENTFVDNFFFRFDAFFIVFLLCLYFCLLRNFEIITCVMKSLIAIQQVEVRLKKEKLKSAFWAPEFGCPNRYTGLPNGVDTH